MKRVFLVVSVFCIGSLFSQNTKDHPAELVSLYLSQSEFVSHELFVPLQNKSGHDLPEELNTYEVFNIDFEALESLRSNSPDGFQLPIQFSEQVFDLNLIQVDLFSDDFVVKEEPNGIKHKIDLGLHYRGIVQGFEGSIVAISIFENEVNGMFSIPGRTGNMVLGKIEDSPSHILYNDNDIKDEFDFVCETAPFDSEEIFNPSSLKSQTVKCPEIFIDV
ncbi:MAG: hypothetical protein HKN45_10225, partial [Flavobacteriales bacterium]|nr:hypothetical protein [Flavobacteriales bacterium]